METLGADHRRGSDRGSEISHRGALVAQEPRVDRALHDVTEDLQPLYVRLLSVSSLEYHSHSVIHLLIA